MSEERLFYHECRAAGVVFKTCGDWMKWLEDNKYDTHKAVAEHGGFKYNINDVCVNPRVTASYRIDNLYHYEVKVANTQYGWIWGYDITTYSSGNSCPASYPSRYDDKAVFFESEREATLDCLRFIVRQLEAKAKNPKASKAVSLFNNAKKQLFNLVHPQMELFPTNQ